MCFVLFSKFPIWGKTISPIFLFRILKKLTVIEEYWKISQYFKKKKGSLDQKLLSVLDSVAYFTLVIVISVLMNS